MKNNVKSSLFLALLFAIGVIILLPIFNFILDITTNIKDITDTFLQCFIFMFIFLIFVFWNASRQKNKIAKKIKEKVLYRELANCFVNKVIIRGVITISKEKLYFDSFNHKGKNYHNEILINDILQITPFNTLWIFPYGLKIITNNKEEKFITNDRKNIINLLNAELGKYPQQ